MTKRQLAKLRRKLTGLCVVCGAPGVLVEPATLRTSVAGWVLRAPTLCPACLRRLRTTEADAAERERAA